MGVACTYLVFYKAQELQVVRNVCVVTRGRTLYRSEFISVIRILWNTLSNNFSQRGVFELLEELFEN